MQVPADKSLSSRFVLMAAKERQRGDYPVTVLEHGKVSLSAGLEVARRVGVPLEDYLPYEGELFAGSPELLYASAIQHCVANYFNLGDADAADPTVHFDGWRRWMAQQGPVVVAVRVDRHMAQGEQHEFRHVDEATACIVTEAMLLGYGSDHFLVRPNWGSAWCDDGYAS